MDEDDILEEQEQPVDVEVEEGEPEVVEEEVQEDFFANLAENLDDRVLTSLASQLISDYKKAYSRILFNDNFHPVPHLAVGRFKNRTEIRDKMIKEGIPTAIHYPYALSDIKILEGKNSYECINSSKFCNEV